MKFFYEPFGGDRIGAVWEPSVRQGRPFRVLAGYSSAPSNKVRALKCIFLTALMYALKDTVKGKDKKGLVILNETAVLSEIRRMASGLLEGLIMQS